MFQDRDFRGMTCDSIEPKKRLIGVENTGAVKVDVF